jgi:uncharacterized protein with ParB-like and HNH nuclease domain
MNYLKDFSVRNNKMQNTAIESKKRNIAKLFSTDFWFTVPNYQRHYVWESDEINNLLDDLWFAFKHNEASEYFLGSLVLLQNGINKEEYDILDGQQRLTTLLLIIAVIRDLSGKVERQKYIQQERNPDEKIEARNRLVFKIRDNVDTFIQEFVMRFNGTQKENLQEYLKEKNISIKNMSKAILLTKDFFANSEKIEYLDNFFSFLLLKVVLIYVSTQNREDAFRLFTILNSRGVVLSNADILKSINLGEITENRENEKYAKIWENIEQDLGNEEFDRFLSFIRTIIVKEKARKSLLDEFNNHIYDEKQNNSKLKKGKDTIDLILKYKNIYDKVIKLKDFNMGNEYTNLITIMDIGLPSTDWIPPLLLYYDKFKQDNICNFLKKLESKFIGDWINGASPTVRIENMNKVLKKIDNTNISDISSLLNDNEVFKVNNNKIKEQFKEDIYSKKYAKYILLKYEYLSQDNTARFSNYKISIEHVLPQNPKAESNWFNLFNEQNREKWTNNLANLILISGRKNSSLQNFDFELKKEKLSTQIKDIFQGSMFVLSQKEWTPEILESRLGKMINLLFPDKI